MYIFSVNNVTVFGKFDIGPISFKTQLGEKCKNYFYVVNMEKRIRVKI